jgi:hypothetical protein
LTAAAAAGGDVVAVSEIATPQFTANPLPLHRGTPNLDAILVAAAGLSRQQLKAFSLNEVINNHAFNLNFSSHSHI